MCVRQSESRRIDSVDCPKQLIIHCDDLGMAHSINLAAFAAFEETAITSASVMVPCPWFAEVCDYACRHPSFDIGIHITLTSEWHGYRWGPISARDRVRSLIDHDGYFHNNVAAFLQSSIPAEVEIEMRAQIELALSRGLRLSHADCHMFAVYKDAHLTELFVKLASEYGLRYLLPPMYGLSSGRECQGQALSGLFQLNTPLEENEVLLWYLSVLSDLPEGLSQLIVHLGIYNDELMAIAAEHIPWGARWRQLDLDVISSRHFLEARKAQGIALADWTSVMY